MGIRRTAACAAALLVAAHGTGRAAVIDAGDPVVTVAPEPSRPTTRAHAIGIDVGFASAIGEFGITFTESFGQAFRLEAGFGWGFSGTQLSLMPKLVLGGVRDHFVTGIGVGYTIGPDARFTVGNPVWLNVDALGYEHLFANGFAFSFEVGFTHGLGGGRYCIIECDDNPFNDDVRTLTGLQTRMGIAYWF